MVEEKRFGRELGGSSQLPAGTTRPVCETVLDNPTVLISPFDSAGWVTPAEQVPTQLSPDCQPMVHETWEMTDHMSEIVEVIFKKKLVTDWDPKYLFENPAFCFSSICFHVYIR